MSTVTIRNARPADARFLAQCILAGLHLADFDSQPNDNISDMLEKLTECERREDTLCTYSHTRIAEVDGQPAGALLSYPGALYKDLRASTLKAYLPDIYAQFANDDPETDPGEYYLDSLAVHPDYRKQGVGRALLEDAIRLGQSRGFDKIALIVDTNYPHLVRIYESMGFIIADCRHVFGGDFQRMVYCVSPGG
jgi:ribosomal protein S18 acetylase RimI-like enzyme